MISMSVQSPGEDLVKKLTEVPFKKKLIKTGHPSTYADDLKLLHELQVQQLEMEMHNEDLRADQLTLEELNRKHTELFEFAPNGYFSLTPDGAIEELNLTGAILLGTSKDQLTDQLLINFIHPQDLETFNICWFNLWETQDYQIFRVRLSKPDGHQSYVKIALAISETRKGFHVLLAMTDVTMVKQIEDAQTFLLGYNWSISGKDFFLALAEYLGKSLGIDFVRIDKFLDDQLNAQTVALYSDGPYGDQGLYQVRQMTWGNLIAQRSFCFPREVRHRFPHDLTLEKTNAESYTGVTLWGSQGKPIGLIVLIGRKPLADPPLTEMVLKQVSIRAAAELEHRQLEETIIQSRDKLEVLVMERTAELEKSNEQLRNEITQRKKAENILLDSQKHLRELTHRMDVITEEERTRIAREIHDELGHLLTALKYDMDELINQSDLTLESVESELGMMIGMVDSLIDSVRQIATDLRPGILDHLGLFPAIEWQISQFRMRTKIGCSFCPPHTEVSFDKNETTIIYRILQEILTNITRHSQASHVKVVLTKKEQNFILRVSDNGIGFDRNDSSNSSLGLMGMQERALSIGGELNIESMPGKGTSITFSLPKVEVSMVP